MVVVGIDGRHRGRRLLEIAMGAGTAVDGVLLVGRDRDEPVLVQRRHRTVRAVLVVSNCCSRGRCSRCGRRRVGSGHGSSVGRKR